MVALVVKYVDAILQGISTFPVSPRCRPIVLELVRARSLPDSTICHQAPASPARLAMRYKSRDDEAGPSIAKIQAMVSVARLVSLSLGFDERWKVSYERGRNS